MVVGFRHPRASAAATHRLRSMSSGNVAAFENLEAIEAIYQRWRQDPASVDESWRWFFQGFELGTSRSPADTDSRQTAVVRLIYAYREIGHFLAHLDPLNEA